MRWAWPPQVGTTELRGRGSRLRWGPGSDRGHAHQEGEAGVKRQ